MSCDFDHLGYIHELEAVVERVREWANEANSEVGVSFWVGDKREVLGILEALEQKQIP